MTVHGRFHTIIACNQTNSSLVVGSNNIDPSQLNTGDTISAYGPDGKPLASATVSSISATSIPAGVSPSTPDTVFGGTYGDDQFYQVQTSPCYARHVLWSLTGAHGIYTPLDMQSLVYEHSALPASLPRSFNPPSSRTAILKFCQVGQVLNAH